MSPDGRLHLIYQSGEHLIKRSNNWKYSLAAGVPCSAGAFFTLAGMSSPYWFMSPIFMAPFAYHLFDYVQMKTLFKNEVYKIWLYKNGD